MPKSRAGRRLSFSVAFRYFAVAMLVIGGGMSLYRIATDTGVARYIRSAASRAAPAPSLPKGAEAARIERLHGELVKVRSAVTAYRAAHGYLPDITSEDVVAAF